MRITQPAGSYDVAVQYFDSGRGASRYELRVNGKPIAHWRANQTLPPAQFDPDLDGQTSTRFTAQNVSLKPGDTLTLFGIPGLRNRVNTRQALDSHSKPHRDDGEFAPVDYIQIGPAGSLTPQN